MLNRQETEIELGNQLASRLRQFRSDRLRLFKAGNVVAAEATVAADQAFTGIQILLFLGHAFQLLASFDIGGIRPQELHSHVIKCGLIDLRKRLLFPFGILQR